jgi:IclR family acetate operon transcriptional repressor
MLRLAPVKTSESPHIRRPRAAQAAATWEEELELELGAEIALGKDAELLHDDPASPHEIMHECSDTPTKWETLPSSVVKSTGRTMQILEFFDHHQAAANIAQVARALDYPQSSTSEIMRSLNVLGYLSYNNRDRTFMPTSRVRLLGTWALDQLHGEDRLSSLVRKANKISGQTAFLAIRNKLASQYIQVAQSTTSLRLHLTPGQQRPLLRSASGRALLKDVSDSEISKLVRRVNAEKQPDESLVCLDELLIDVNFIRENKYLYLGRSEISPGAAVIALSLPEDVFPVPTVIGIGGAAVIIESRKDALIEGLSELVRDHLLTTESAPPVTAT